MVFVFGFAILIVLAVLFGRRGIRWRRVAQLEVGMTAKEVIKKVGKPYSITTFENGDELWQFIEVFAKSNGSFSLHLRNGKAIKVPNLAALQAEDRLRAEHNDSRSKYLRWIALLVCGWIVLVAFLAISGKKAVAPDKITSASSAQDAHNLFDIDCSNVTAETVKLICNTPKLAKADSRLAKAFRDALARTSSKAALRREERTWIALRNNAPADVSQLADLYERRIAELKRYPSRPQSNYKKKEAIEPSSSTDGTTEAIQAEQSPIEPTPAVSTSPDANLPRQ